MTPTNYEPKMNNRFFVEFPQQFNVQRFCVEKINKPKFTNGVWENIVVGFIDVVAPSTSQSLFKIIKFLKTNECDNKKLFDIKIKTLDPTGIVEEEWVISVEKVLTISFGDLDYSKNEILKPFMILKPLNCVLNF